MPVENLAGTHAIFHKMFDCRLNPKSKLEKFKSYNPNLKYPNFYKKFFGFFKFLSSNLDLLKLLTNADTAAVAATVAIVIVY